jgi:DNA gyrase subunit B
MRDVIERGYLYVAQPPLYKIKIGQKESYIKNDEFLKEYLVDHFLNNHSISLFSNSNHDFIKFSNDGLENTLSLYQKINQIISGSCLSEPELAEIVFASIIKNQVTDLRSSENLEKISLDLSSYFGFDHKVSLNEEECSSGIKKFSFNIFYIIQNVHFNIKIDLSHFLSGKIDKKFIVSKNFDVNFEETLSSDETKDLLDLNHDEN